MEVVRQYLETMNVSHKMASGKLGRLSFDCAGHDNLCRDEKITLYNILYEVVRWSCWSLSQNNFQCVWSLTTVTLVYPNYFVYIGQPS